MKFEFLSDEANDCLELCKRAKLKKEEYIKNLGRKVSKNEDDELSKRFVLEELAAYAEELQNSQEQNQILDKKNNIKHFDDIDDLEFDEMNDVWDEMDDF